MKSPAVDRTYRVQSLRVESILDLGSMPVYILQKVRPSDAFLLAVEDPK
jgi:hypothetical protein